MALLCDFRKLKVKVMNGFWEQKFEELAKFNADNDKSKYSDEYLKKMAFMQEDYIGKQVAWARANGYIVV